MIITPIITPTTISDIKDLWESVLDSLFLIFATFFAITILGSWYLIGVIKELAINKSPISKSQLGANCSSFKLQCNIYIEIVDIAIPDILMQWISNKAIREIPAIEYSPITDNIAEIEFADEDSIIALYDVKHNSNITNSIFLK